MDFAIQHRNSQGDALLGSSTKDDILRRLLRFQLRYVYHFLFLFTCKFVMFSFLYAKDQYHALNLILE